MFSRFMTTTVFAVSLALVGCASKKPVNNPDSLTSTDSSMNSSSSNALELKGSSDNGTAGGLTTVYFEFDSFTLDGSAKDALTANADYLKANPTVDVQIEGHCDERGGIQYNLALGERRAKSVKEFLVAMGVEKNRVSVVSYGKEKPAAFGHDEGAWSRNRRGNFVITAK
jgi:peptidoglycan-associated lipoprotein